MRHRAAFTLVELLVVLAIVAVLATLALPAFQRALQAGRTSACLLNLKQLGTALNLYLGEHNLIMPTLQAGRADKTQDVPVIDDILLSYAKDARVFACPADARGLAAATGTSYYWNTALNGQPLANLKFFTIDSQSHIPILADKEGFHPYETNKVNILYADGRATKDLSFMTSK